MGRLYPAKNAAPQILPNNQKTERKSPGLSLCFCFFYSFARKNAQISSHTSFWKKWRSAWSASSIESSVTSHPAFSSSSCSSSPCPNGTVWSSSPWMIRNGGAAFVTKLTGQHASASSGWRITFLPIRRDSGDAAHCSGSLYGNPRKSVGGNHGQAACTALEYSRFSPTS